MQQSNFLKYPLIQSLHYHLPTSDPPILLPTSRKCKHPHNQLFLSHEFPRSLLTNTRNSPPTLLKRPPCRIMRLCLVEINGCGIFVDFVKEEFVGLVFCLEDVFVCWCMYMIYRLLLREDIRMFRWEIIIEFDRVKWSKSGYFRVFLQFSTPFSISAQDISNKNPTPRCSTTHIII